MNVECTSKKDFLNRSFLMGFALYTRGLVLALAITSSAIAGENAAAGLAKLLPGDAPGEWRATGDLVTARAYQTATLLPNGQVLVAGGIGSDSAAISSAELYDPARGVWTATGSRSQARDHAPITLPRTGRVGGVGGSQGVPDVRHWRCAAHVLFAGSLIDFDRALAGRDQHAGDGALTAAGAAMGVACGMGHQSVFNSFGCCATCSCSAAACRSWCA